MGSFILHHQDGDIEYVLENGGFAIDDGKLYLSLTGKALDNKAFPDRYMFAVDGFPWKENFKEAQFKISTNPDDEPPNVYVYTTFHASDVSAAIQIQHIESDAIFISFEVVSEDVNYYDQRAKANSFVGKSRLLRKQISDLWIPA